MESEEFSDLLDNKKSDFHQDHHHKDTFITKYIFSQDHKMIAKQYLITGVLFTKFHNILQKGKDLKMIEKMIKANWTRTLLWTLRIIMILFVIP